MRLRLAVHLKLQINSVRKNRNPLTLISPGDNGAGLGHDTNKVNMVHRDNNIDKFELKTKEDAAIYIQGNIFSFVR